MRHCGIDLLCSIQSGMLSEHNLENIFVSRDKMETDLRAVV